MSARLAIFRCDASLFIGGGHVFRCLALAEGLQNIGWNCIFAITRETINTVPALTEARHSLIVLTGADDEASIKAAIPEGCHLLVVDHYMRDATFEASCRPWAHRILTIDDLANRPHDCDFLLDQTLGRQSADYSQLTPSRSRMLLGPDFALLRPQFSAARHEALARRETGGTARRLLISLGATDPTNMTSRVISAAAGLPLELDIVLGAENEYREAVLESVKRYTMPARIHADVSDMAALMVQADLAVGAGGTTSWERCCLGLPSLILVLANNQRDIATALDKAGAAVNLGAAENISDQDLNDALRSLFSDTRRMAIMAERAATICDGGGVNRVLKALENG